MCIVHREFFDRILAVHSGSTFENQSAKLWNPPCITVLIRKLMRLPYLGLLLNVLLGSICVCSVYAHIGSFSIGFWLYKEHFCESEC